VSSLGIIGRAEELRVIRAFLDAAGDPPRALLLEGEAGIGKTTLWRAGLEAAGGGPYRLLVAQADAREVELAFAVVADLLESVVADALPELPAPQRRALEIALLLEDHGSETPQPRAVAAAFLTTLRVLSRGRPLLVAIDDVQWLDPASLGLLEYAVRRLEKEAIALFLTRRGDATEHPAPLGLARAFPEEHLTRVHVGPLSLGALQELLRTRLDLTLARPNLRRLAEASGGNAFFALEFARALTRRGLRVELGEPLPVPETLRGLVADRLAELPEATRDALLVAAIASKPTLDIVRRTLDGDPWERLHPAVQALAIELEGESILFAHPLIASVVHGSVDLRRRRDVHRRLAEVLSDPEECARHLALAAEHPDANVASALEAAAGQVRRRGAADVAAALAERAARLTPPEQGEDGRRRTIQAADYHLDAGAHGHARSLLEELASGAAPGSARAEVLVRLAQVHFAEGGWRLAIPPLRTALADAGDDVRLRQEIERTFSWACQMDCDLLASEGHARTAVDLAEQLGDADSLAPSLATLAFVACLRGRGLAHAMIERAVALEGQIGRVGIVEVRPSWIHALLLFWADDLERAQSILERLRVESLDEGGERSAPFILNWLARTALRTGDWGRAEELAHEALESAVETSEEPFVLSALALVEAHLGHVEGAREKIEQGLALAARLATKPAGFEFLATRGFLELSTGDADQAHRTLGPLVDAVAEAGFREPAVFRFHPDEIESLIMLGRLQPAAALLQELEAHAHAVGGKWAAVTAARCRGLLECAEGDLPAACEHLQAACDPAALPGEPFELARSLLALGIALRRAKRRADARGVLQRARSIFEQLGASLWVDKASAELARIGGRAPSAGALTPTERRVAELVAEGRSNKEIAAALFVTPKTVGTKLSRIYAKLGVHSRTELVHHLSKQPASKV
jgi:DNA-binding CsgD family transcriptional regulator